MNHLAHETSPYLLQHIDNPVDWYPWGEEALQKARLEDKPILVSIGYSACHWCHVMAHECFEDENIAAIMNEYFVCIKVDREERPDVDAIYMDALHAMGLRGGWPLNVFLMPNGQPFYGGTYFPPTRRSSMTSWPDLCVGIARAFSDPENRLKLANSAEGFTANMQFSETEKYGLNQSNNAKEFSFFQEVFAKISARFDPIWGGYGQAPKFPMPSIYLFLLRYYYFSKDEIALHQIKWSLDKMALGGIFDQLGGGFARYSTDAEWFCPHFEKMLYDNGQLLQVYAEAFTLTQSPLYAQVIRQTVAWIDREMTLYLSDNESNMCAFYSALDADSEGVEGKFYTWSKEEIVTVLGQKAPEVLAAYQVTEQGNWAEEGTNIFWLADTQHQPNDNIRDELMRARAQRVRPGLDDKVLTSWNGLTIKGLCEVYRAMKVEKALDLARKNARFIVQKMMQEDESGAWLWHTHKNGVSKIKGFLEDYAAVISGLIALYEVTFEEQWLHFAEKLALYSYQHFWDNQDEFFYFTDDSAEVLIARKKEIFDNVIPASNSIMAQNFFLLGKMLDRSDFSSLALHLLSKIETLLGQDANYLTNWAALSICAAHPTAEVVIMGKNSDQLRQEIEETYHPNKVIMGAELSSDLPLLKDKNALNDKETKIYVCFEQTCQRPVATALEAFELLRY
jgi:uncharacterized protein